MSDKEEKKEETTEKKKPKGELSVEEVTKTLELFSSRTEGETMLEKNSGVEFMIEPLPNSVLADIQGKSTDPTTGQFNEGIAYLLAFRCGVKDWKNATKGGKNHKPEFEDYKIFGTNEVMKRLTLKSISGLQQGVINTIGFRVMYISDFTAAHLLRLDFTIPSS